MKTGRLYWITGLAGAGKTTLAKRLFLELKQDKANTVLLDGDTLRCIYRLPPEYYAEDLRHGVAMRHAQMCEMLTSQGIDVICATISMFEDVRHWNRKHTEEYIEIFIDVSEATLQRRDQNQIYSGYLKNVAKHVVGKDIKAEFPKNPDIILHNEGKSGIEPLFIQLKKILDQRNIKQ